MLFKPMALLTAITLTGCAGVDLSTYQGERPVLKLEEYFNGTIDGWGMFQKRDGTVVKRFKVVVEASWEGDHGVLDEQFTYSDGTKQQRIWRLTKTGEDEYTGTADDVVGRAQGRISGNALQWAYSLRLPVGEKVYEVTFDDWMYLQEEGVLLNRSVMKKFGFRLGEVLLFFKRRGS
ncbi:MAG: hypothetical protein B6D72_12560 [gamma proteobacterium symbiont of Ctena orbiculata]|uniref:DUF3833 domain-containing protein n=1 Tax=Candidatus Thiodiazotropha taylori TaxID=2792791 RepID=A0A944MBS9_9GAMM|nr:DUF3833 domain-containing protein [Candidatus Thiodiazotropha taylori]PUB82065.1 MAG: DUF3833 domain-containing protein [gamma proteobacterium symbiont of Ctena orbiculata]MBT2991101.1 DUF3833 domain-containing protein [Candidatus Thiodiazotropha taylori]MBT2998735.1 DUF3833 domain-containing protein [Candidatus Thiodiazotropha taylori]MBT3002348.1 DUF3833 domain-containing protein [Candidatus Thiodiazotropha taylori]